MPRPTIAGTKGRRRTSKGNRVDGTIDNPRAFVHSNTSARCAAPRLPVLQAELRSSATRTARHPMRAPHDTSHKPGAWSHIASAQYRRTSQVPDKSQT